MTSFTDQQKMGYNLALSVKSHRLLLKAHVYGQEHNHKHVTPHTVLLMLIIENKDQCYKIFNEYGLKMDEIVDKLCDKVRNTPISNCKCSFSDETIKVINNSWSVNGTPKQLLVSADKLFENLVCYVFKKIINVRNTEITSLNLF